MKEIKGNLVEMSDEFDVIGHGCNCLCTMGAGIAKVIKEKFPESYEVDLKTERGERGKLGTVSYTKNTSPIIVNCYTQYAYGKGRMNCDYEALRSCMKEIKRLFHGKKIGLPMIGCGLAGGEWEIVKPIISEELSGEDVTIVIFEK
jgi:O-acetyl-ADP-ribose deacetylase (regulator of RNase III)